MTRLFPRAGGIRNAERPATTPAELLPGIRAVHRAIGEMRRGTPVLLEGTEPLAVLGAETAGAEGLAAFAELTRAPASLLLAPVRAAAVLGRPAEPALSVVALRVPPALFDPTSLRGLADPTAEQLVGTPPEPVAAPEQGAAVLLLAKLARLLPAALVAPVPPDAPRRASSLGLIAVGAGDLLAYPDTAAAQLVRVAEAAVPLQDAPDARIVAFRAPDAGIEHLAVLVGRPETAEAPLVRVHSECFTGDLLGSMRCDCGDQLRQAIARIAAEGAGALIYLAQEGRGIGLVNKLRAYALQDQGLDTLDANRALGWGADERGFLAAATMLEALGLRRVRLLTNNPDKLAALEACGVTVVGRVRHAIAANGVNDQYLETKARRFGHLLG